MTIKQKFNQLKKQNKKAFIAYIPFGFPSIAHTKDIILTLQDADVDIIEVGIPFSDPIADGPIIQEATSYALKKGATVPKLFFTLSQIKNQLKVPLVLMSYYNPVFRFGLGKFFAQMHRFSISGIMIVDLPVEESAEYIKEAKNFHLETIFFVTPTTINERTKKIVKVSKGFIYYISVTGITGPKELSYDSLRLHIKSLRKLTDLPICVGFGIHTKEQVRSLSKFSDGVIVGSGLVKFIARHHTKRGFLNNLQSYIQSLHGK